MPVYSWFTVSSRASPPPGGARGTAWPTAAKLGQAVPLTLDAGETLQNVRNVVKAAMRIHFPNIEDWAVHIEIDGSVRAFGPDGLFRTGIHFPPSVTTEEARKIAGEARNWIIRQQNIE